MVGFKKMKILIRDFQPSDYQQVVELWRELDLGRPERGDTLEVILRTVRNKGKLILMFDADNRILIGTSWITTDFRRTYLHHFGIKTAYQGKGLAHKLMEATMKYAKELGFQVKLEVHQNNYRAVKLYEKWGFRKLGDYLVYIIRKLEN